MAMWSMLARVPGILRSCRVKTVVDKPVESLGEQLLPAGADRPRGGALRVVGQGEDESADARMGRSDPGLPVRLSAFVLAPGGRSGYPGVDLRLFRRGLRSRSGPFGVG